MATITRIDLANALRNRFGLTAADSYRMIDIIFDEIEQSLINGEDVKITGFGTFKILSKSARIGRNPKTGVPALISARRVASFRPSNDFKAAMELAGFKTTHPHNKVIYHGIRLLTDNELGVEDDFLS